MMSLPREVSDQASAMIPTSQWQAFRTILQQKYECEDLTLKAVREYMLEAHGFSASPSQYQRAFKKWGFRKNTKRRDAEDIIVSAKRRRLSLSQIVLEGASLREQEKFQRVLRRYNMPSLPYTLQDLRPWSKDCSLSNDRLLSWSGEGFGPYQGDAVAATSRFHIMPHITSLPTFNLISQLGWRLPDTVSLQLRKMSFSLLTTRSISLKLSQFDTGEDALSLQSIIFMHKILNQTLNHAMSEKLFSFISEGSMDPILHHLCRSKSYLAKAFIKILLSICIWGIEHHPWRKAVLQKLTGFGIDCNITLLVGYRIEVDLNPIRGAEATLLQLAIGLRRFDLAIDLIQGGADVNLCGVHGNFTDYRQPRCCNMLPIALLLEHSVGIITDETEAARLLTIMQKADLVCCQALCLSSVATHQCLSWFLTKPGIDLDTPNLAQVYNVMRREDYCWLSPLQSAIYQSNYATVSMLLEAGARPSGFRFGDLQRSCSKGCEDRVYTTYFNDEYSKCQSCRNLRSLFKLYVAMPPLSVASFRGDLAILRLLLSTGVPINGCQLDFHRQKDCFSLGTHDPICQSCGDYFSRERQGQTLWKTLRSLPRESLSKFGDKSQLVKYSVHYGHSALQLAVVTSQEDVLHELIRHGADIEGCHGFTPLTLAICVGNATLVDILLEYGANPRGLCKNGQLITPFAVAAYLNDVAHMKKLMATGRILCYETSLPHECGPWEAALRGKSYGAISYLSRLQLSGDLIWDSGDAASLITLAMSCSHWSLAQDFLNRWGHILTMVQIRYVLRVSIRNADLAVTARLMALGGILEDGEMMNAALQIDVNDAQHRRCFIAFIFQAMSETEPDAIVDMITDCDSFEFNREAITTVIAYLNTHYAMTAAGTRNLLVTLLEDQHYDDAALCLLENSMYTECCGERPEMTGLQYAAQTSNSKLVRRLVQLGADVNTRAAADPLVCSGTMTVLQFAVFRMQIKIVELLLDYGADVNAQGDYAVLQVATWNDCIDEDLIDLLLERGADVNAIGAEKQSETALQNAAKGDATDIAKTLLARGAQVNAPARGNFGRTALQASVQNENHALFKLLLSNGADVNALPAPYGGVTALQAAAIVGDLEMCQALVAAGAKVDADGSPKEGRTAIEGAAEHGRLDVLSWLLSILVHQHQGQDLQKLKASIESAKEFAKKNKKDYIVQFLEDFGRNL